MLAEVILFFKVNTGVMMVRRAQASIDILNEWFRIPEVNAVRYHLLLVLKVSLSRSKFIKQHGLTTKKPSAGNLGKAFCRYSC
jgi:hypothetical protein